MCGWTVMFLSYEADAHRDPIRFSANSNQYDIHFLFKYSCPSLKSAIFIMVVEISNLGLFS